MSVRVVIAHRSTLVRDVLRFLGAPKDVLVVGEARGRADLLDLCASERPDVALAEATFADGTEIESCVAQLLADGARVGVICDDPSPERLTRILTLGVSGYLRSDAAPTSVVEAVATLAAGAAVLEPRAMGTLLEQWRGLRKGGKGTAGGRLLELTARERDVLAALTDGLSSKAIARRLGVAPKTVENHKTRIFDKLGVRSQAAAVSFVIAHGLLAGLSDSQPRDCSS
jgi:DNA-binding NarL/FixJ family response regulator